MHTWNSITRTQKFSFSVHMKTSASSEMLRRAGQKEDESAPLGRLHLWDRVDKGSYSQESRCVRGPAFVSVHTRTHTHRDV